MSRTPPNTYRIAVTVAIKSCGLSLRENPTTSSKKKLYSLARSLSRHWECVAAGDFNNSENSQLDGGSAIETGVKRLEPARFATGRVSPVSLFVIIVQQSSHSSPMQKVAKHLVNVIYH